MNLLISLFASASALLPQLGQAETILFAGVEDNQIVAGRLGEAPMQLTQEQAHKRFPVRSKDGAQIAFIQDSPDKSALADLVVIDANGRFRASWPVGYVKPGEIRSGMRFVEELEWIDDNRIAVRGSINPSTSDYEVITVSDGSTTGFADDGAGAAFSSDGKHVAYMTGAPHFGGERTPTLTIDDVPAATPFPADIEEVERPVWSDDGRSVALMARRPEEVTWMIAHADVEHGGNLLKPHSVPFSGRAVVHWSGSLLQVQSGTQETYAWTSGAWALVKQNLLPVDSRAAGAALQRQLRAERWGDFWCAHCALSSLPRRSANSHE